jgi:TRAP-type mannitol/chloroaromatic compound transport system permease small subunit
VGLLLGISRAIDALNARVGQAVRWLVLLAVVISAGNAGVRYLFDASSNAWLEAQWYLFAAVFLLCAGYTLLRGEHVRIDILSSRLSPRTQAWIELLCTIFFLMPMALLILRDAWPMLVTSYLQHEQSSDAGGLLRWPAKALIPAGFLLLVLQGVSEILKRVLFLAGALPPPPRPEGPQGHAEVPAGGAGA